MIQAIKEAAFGIIILAMLSCNPYPDVKQYDDTPTSGSIKISCDNTFYNIIDGELDTFHALYKYANVDCRYCSESEAIKDLLNDTARVAIVSRALNDQERAVFAKQSLTPRELIVAIDAIAFVVHNDNTDTVLSAQQLQKMLNGDITDWKQLSASNSMGQLVMVFDDVNSSTATYARDIINKGSPIKGNVFAVKTSTEVVEYVKKTKGAIGVLGVSYISDGDDPASKTFLNSIKVVSIKNETDGTRYKPYQAYVAQNLYPFTRNVYMISREARSGLGTGFTSFVAGDVGQRIILKMGILPKQIPPRLVGIREY